MGTGLHMHGDEIGARLGQEGFEIRIARRDHEMHVERLVGVPPQCPHHVGPDGDVGYEMPVHDVHMDPIGARFVDRAHFFAQLGEIGGQDGWGDGKRAMHRYLGNGVDRIGGRAP